MNVYEQRVIGGMIAGLVAAESIALSPSDFADLGDVYEKAREIALAGKLDAELLASRQGGDSFHGVRDFQLWAASANSASVVFDAVEQVKSASLKAFLLSEAASLALRSDAAAPELLESLRRIVEHADSEYRTVADDFVMIADLVPQVKTVLDDLHAGTNYSLSTGFSEFDRQILDGFSKGDLHVIAGSTGSGKTALALNIALNQAKSNNLVGLVSREMSSTENIIRLLCSDTATERWKVRRAMFDDTYATLLGTLRDKFRPLPFAINTATTSVQMLRPQVKRWVEQKGLTALYVDYLQLLASDARHNSRADEISTVSRTLKLIAMENNIPVVALCQFNRGANNADDFDLLGYLKESSGIEQDASTVTHIKIERSESPRKAASLRVLKNRNGATMHTVELDYDGPTFTFRERTGGIYATHHDRY